MHVALLIVLLSVAHCGLYGSSYEVKIYGVNTDNYPDACYVEFTVLDEQGNFVENLKLSDFEIMDGAAPNFGCKRLLQCDVRDTPLDVVFIVDDSFSMFKYHIKFINAIKELLNNMNEYFLVRVGFVRFGQSEDLPLECPNYASIEKYDDQFFFPLRSQSDVDRFADFMDSRLIMDGWYEPYYEVLDWVVNQQLDFRSGALKMFVLIGDESEEDEYNRLTCSYSSLLKTYSDYRYSFLNALESDLSQTDLIKTFKQNNSQVFVVEKTSNFVQFDALTEATGGICIDINSESYSTIITKLYNKIKGRYIMRFCTDSLQAEAYCSDDDRIITVEYKGDGSSIGSSRYHITKSASIVRAPATKELDYTLVDAGKEIPIEIDIIRNGSTVGKVDLFYKSASDPDFKILTLYGGQGVERGDTVRYMFTIPASAVLEPYIQYYIEADTYNVYNGSTGQQAKVSSPPYYRNDFCWNIAVKPNRVPIVEKVDAMPAYPCSVMEIKAHTDGIEPYIVALHYRVFGTPGEYQEVAMAPDQSSGVYVGIIPKKAFVDLGVEYYITARSNAGVVGRYGSSDNPLYVSADPTGTVSRKNPMEIVFGSRNSVMIGCESLADGDTIAAYYTSQCEGDVTEYLMSKSAWSSSSQSLRLTVYGKSGPDYQDGYAEGDSIMLRLIKRGKDYEMRGHSIRYSSSVKRVFFEGVTIGRQTPAVEILSGGNSVPEGGTVDFGVCTGKTSRTITVKNSGCEKLLILQSELESDCFVLETPTDSIVVEPDGTYDLLVSYIPYEDSRNTLCLHTNTDEHNFCIALEGKSSARSACMGMQVLTTATESGENISLSLKPKYAVEADISLRAQCSTYPEWNVKKNLEPGANMLNIGNMVSGDYKISIYTTEGLCEYPLQIQR